MYARTTVIRGDKKGIGEGMAYIRDEAMPQMRSMDGFVGISMLAEGVTGRCIVTSAWADAGAMEKHAEKMGQMRGRLVQSFHGEPDVDEWEIAVVHRVNPAGDGGHAHVTWARGDQMEKLVEGYKNTLLPELEQLPGFRSISIMVDRDGGRLVSTVTFESPETLTRNRARAHELGDGLAAELGAEVTDRAEMDLLMAHLHVPETA
jgi:heme-degrading monooxygenase HmoA